MSKIIAFLLFRITCVFGCIGGTGEKTCTYRRALTNRSSATSRSYLCPFFLFVGYRCRWPDRMERTSYLPCLSSRHLLYQRHVVRERRVQAKGLTFFSVGSCSFRIALLVFPLPSAYVTVFELCTPSLQISPNLRPTSGGRCSSRCLAVSHISLRDGEPVVCFDDRLDERSWSSRRTL